MEMPEETVETSYKKSPSTEDSIVMGLTQCTAGDEITYAQRSAVRRTEQRQLARNQRKRSVSSVAKRKAELLVRQAMSVLHPPRGARQPTAEEEGETVLSPLNREGASRQIDFFIIPLQEKGEEEQEEARRDTAEAERAATVSALAAAALREDGESRELVLEAARVEVAVVTPPPSHCAAVLTPTPTAL